MQCAHKSTKSKQQQQQSQHIYDAENVPSTEHKFICVLFVFFSIHLFLFIFLPNDLIKCPPCTNQNTMYVLAVATSPSEIIVVLDFSSYDRPIISFYF